MREAWGILLSELMSKDPIILAHRAAIAKRVEAYHSFLSSYSKEGRVIYGFVEGKQDPSYYRGVIDGLKPSAWEIRLIPAGTKSKVYDLYRMIDWRRYKKKRICFFVDRDLSDLIPENWPSHDNLFVTSKYSIENYFDSKNVCDRVLTEVYSLSGVDHSELSKTLILFEEQREEFFKAMVPVMARILTWRRDKMNASLDNIKLSQLFNFEFGKLRRVPLPSGISNIDELLHKQCKLNIDTSADVNASMVEFNLVKNYRNLVRGKFVMWFVIEFCKSIHAGSVKIFRAVKSVPKALVELSCSNGVAILGPRVIPPRGLVEFLKNNYCEYIVWHDAHYSAN